MTSFIWRLVVCLLLCSVISVAVKAFPSHVQPIQQQLIKEIASGKMAPQNLPLDTLIDLMQLTKRLGGAENEGAYETLQREYKRRTPPPPYSPGPPPAYRDLTPPRQAPPLYQPD